MTAERTTLRPSPREIETLFSRQLAEWPLAQSNYDALSRVQTREMTLGTRTVRIQFNPARLRSSAARTDSRSIAERPCFLCAQHLPAEQCGLPFGTDYRVLVNPYPIFPRHLTIPCVRHTPQRIAGRYADMLALAQTLTGFTVFYNGPHCGASAPDHMHFQAGSRGFLPIERDVAAACRHTLLRTPRATACTLPHDPRHPLVIEASQAEAAVCLLERICDRLPVPEGHEEPMLNLLTWYDAGRWTVCLFSRRAHRPACFHAEGDAHLLISPASVDMGGVFITPREDDFLKITARDVQRILEEVCLPTRPL